MSIVTVQKSSFRQLLLVLFLGTAANTAQAIPIDFEIFADNFALTNEVTGLTVLGGAVLTAGLGLNEIDFPPTSGLNVLAAPSGSLTFGFLDPITDFSAYFTFNESLAFTAFNAGGDLLLSFGSTMASNLGSATLIQFNTLGISSLLIANLGGSGFTLDDLSFSSMVPPISVSEPSTLPLLAIAGLAAVLVRRRKGKSVASS